MRKFILSPRTLNLFEECPDVPGGYFNNQRSMDIFTYLTL